MLINECSGRHNISLIMLLNIKLPALYGENDINIVHDAMTTQKIIIHYKTKTFWLVLFVVVDCVFRLTFGLN